MKEINLRKYYPHYTQDVLVEIPDEVADLLKELTRSEDAYRIRTYRHKAVYSLDLMNELRELPADGPMPGEILEQGDLRELLYAGLQSLPEKQKTRIIAYYFLGMSQVEIPFPANQSARGRRTYEDHVSIILTRGETAMKNLVRAKVQHNGLQEWLDFVATMLWGDA